MLCIYRLREGFKVERTACSNRPRGLLLQGAKSAVMNAYKRDDPIAQWGALLCSMKPNVQNHRSCAALSRSIQWLAGLGLGLPIRLPFIGAVSVGSSFEQMRV